MNDNDNIKELIGARLEEIHLSETMADTMPSDEEILRWEALADARRAQKQRNKRRLLSLAAVFLLAIVVGVAVIVSPPDAEAGGDGRAVIVDSLDSGGKVITRYESLDKMPTTISESFIILDARERCWKTREIKNNRTNNTMQLEITYTNSKGDEINIYQLKNMDGSKLENVTFPTDRKIRIENIDVYIYEDTKDDRKETLNFVYRDVYICIYCETEKEDEVVKLIKEAL